jgi:hypothetical protein
MKSFWKVLILLSVCVFLWSGEASANWVVAPGPYVAPCAPFPVYTTPVYVNAPAYYYARSYYYAPVPAPVYVGRPVYYAPSRVYLKPRTYVVPTAYPYYPGAYVVY